jgi:glycosyltransferase involved in cell wall biosynthesis
MKKGTIIVTGMGTIWAGVTNPAEGLAQHGIQTHFLCPDTREYYNQHIPQGCKLTYLPNNPLKAAWMLWKTIRQEKPLHVEFYNHFSPRFAVWRQIALAFIQVPLTVVCTGAEILYWENHSFQRRLLIRWAFKMARVVFIKELYMRDYVHKYRIGDPSKLVFIHNRIPVLPLSSYTRRGRIVLFMNTFKSWRNLDLIVKAVPRVLERFPDAQFRFVGMMGRPAEASIAALVQTLGLEDHVHLLPFTKNPEQEYMQASVFILPADVVFCNNALLEAMERGVPPIVADVPGAERIVEDNVSGLRVERTPEAIADAIIRLFSDEDERCRLARGARRKIEEEFDERQRTEQLLDHYSRVWA